MTSSKLKFCSSCGETFPTEFFHKNKALKDGLHTICKPCNGAKSAKWKKENPERAKENDYKRKYGLSYAEYGHLLSTQNGACAICNTRFEDAQRGVLFVDHCHKTGKVRGLLCQNCNTAIGLLQDNPLFCTKAAKYLLESKSNDG